MAFWRNQYYLGRIRLQDSGGSFLIDLDDSTTGSVAFPLRYFVYGTYPIDYFQNAGSGAGEAGGGIIEVYVNIDGFSTLDGYSSLSQYGQGENGSIGSLDTSFSYLNIYSNGLVNAISSIDNGFAGLSLFANSDINVISDIVGLSLLRQYLVVSADGFGEINGLSSLASPLNSEISAGSVQDAFSYLSSSLFTTDIFDQSYIENALLYNALLLNGIIDSISSINGLSFLNQYLDGGINNLGDVSGLSSLAGPLSGDITGNTIYEAYGYLNAPLLTSSIDNISFISMAEVIIVLPIYALDIISIGNVETAFATLNIALYSSIDSISSQNGLLLNNLSGSIEIPGLSDVNGQSYQSLLGTTGIVYGNSDIAGQAQNNCFVYSSIDNQSSLNGLPYVQGSLISEISNISQIAGLTYLNIGLEGEVSENIDNTAYGYLSIDAYSILDAYSSIEADLDDIISYTYYEIFGELSGQSTIESLTDMSIRSSLLEGDFVIVQNRNFDKSITINRPIGLYIRRNKTLEVNNG